MKKINPNLIKLAELTHNPDLKIDKTILEKKLDTETSNVPNLKGYIYVPPIKLYVAKERTLYGKNWYEAHEELHKQGLQMLIIPEFIEFIKYLKQNPNQENNKVLDEILAEKDPRRSEWLDAYFEQRDDGLYILTKNKTKQGLLEACLMRDIIIPGISLDDWLRDATSQGLPKENTLEGESRYWCPSDGYVAGFGADSNGAFLDCYWNPENSDSSLGIRVAKTRN